MTVPPVRCTCGKLLQPPPTGGFRCPFCGQVFQAAAAPAVAPATAPAPMVSAPLTTPEPQQPPPSPELEEIDDRPGRRRTSGTPVLRILWWVLMSVFLTIPLVFMGVYTYMSFKNWDKKLQKAAAKAKAEAKVESKKPQYVIPDNINWDRPDWSKFGEWSGSGGLYRNSKTSADKLISIQVVRPRLKFVMEASPSRGTKKPETANFRMINLDDSSIQSLIGGMRAPGNFTYDSYENAGRKGVPLGTYNLQVEVQGNPNWHIVAYEDLQFPDGSKPQTTSK